MTGGYDVYTDWAAITPSDANPAIKHNAIYVGGAGNIALRARKQVPNWSQTGSVGDNPQFENHDVVLTAVPVGTILPVSAYQVLATGTTATLLIGLRAGG